VNKNCWNQNELTKRETREKIQNANFESISNLKIVSICILPNDQILATTDFSIRVFNGELKEIKVQKVPQWTAIGCAISPKNEIYISDYSNSCINIYDLNLNKITCFGSNGKDNNQFDGIYRIIWRKTYLYVCDRWNKRIQIYDIDLKHIDSITLHYTPWSIEISKKTLGICGNTGTYFYDLNTKELIKSYVGLYGGINLINSNFFVTSYSPEPNKVNCYDHRGDLIEEIKVSKEINKLISGPLYYQILQYKKKLVFFSYLSNTSEHY
jgi:hypothetical protein